MFCTSSSCTNGLKRFPLFPVPEADALVKTHIEFSDIFPPYSLNINKVLPIVHEEGK